MPAATVVTTADPKSPPNPQPSLWDTLSLRRRPGRARVSRRARRMAQAPTQPPSPTPSAVPALQPLHVGPPWPERDVVLTVEGDTASGQRRFSFRRALWCGAQCYALLAPWESRDDSAVALVSVGIERVRVLAAHHAEES